MTRIVMKSYLKFLSRNKLYTAIEAVGLIVSLAFVIIIGSSIRDQLGIVYNVPDHDNLYLVGPASGHSIVGEYRVKEELASIPEIQETAAFTIEQAMVQIAGDNRLVAIGMMDPNLFGMIPLRILSGSREPFESGEGVAITVSAARRFFPDRDPVGEALGWLENPTSQPVPTRITSVIEDPSYSILGDFDFAVSLQSRLCPRATEVRESDMGHNGRGSVAYLFSRLHEGIQVDSVLNTRIRNLQGWFLSRDEKDARMLTAYDDIYLSEQTQFALRQGKRMYLSVLIALVILLLVSAILSYVNLSMAVTGDRAREMATRRLVGEEPQGSHGTKVFALGGKVKNVGLVEVPMGTTLRELIYDIGGGVPNGKKFKAIQTGGPSGGCLTEKDLDVEIDFDNLVARGSMMGSGGAIVMDEDNCMVDVAKFYMEFICDESCGKCSPCRIGTKRILEILNKITSGKGEPEDLEALKELAKATQTNSLCALGQTAANPILSTMKNFPEEYKAHVVDKKCPAHVCKAMIQYVIDPEKCKKCSMCSRNCPVGAISGEVGKTPFVIDQAKCIKCGMCLSSCKFGAVLKK